jgi:hypothetical protein
LVIHIHHVFVRQCKSSRIGIFLVFSTEIHLPPLGCDTSGASLAALYRWLKIIYPQSEYSLS